MIKSKDIQIVPFQNNHLKSYIKDDWVLDLVLPTEKNRAIAQNFVCNEWLIESPAKRMIFSHTYGDLFKRKNNNELKVLDIGAGVNLSQKNLAQYHELTVLDILVHDKRNATLEYYKENNIKLIENDWFETIDKIEPVDLIIVNDLFPNADQRLPEFLKKIKGKCKELRLVLTHYSDGRSYKVKRFQGDEIMFLRAWDGSNTVEALQRSITGVSSDIAKKLSTNRESLFPNKRHCCLLKIKFDG